MQKEFIFDIDSCSENMYAKYRWVRDHCHFTGKYKGAVHANCSLNNKKSKQIPIVFHNCSTYDYYFVIK